jgi:hypothetical protein
MVSFTLGRFAPGKWSLIFIGYETKWTPWSDLELRKKHVKFSIKIKYIVDRNLQLKPLKPHAYYMHHKLHHSNILHSVHSAHWVYLRVSCDPYNKQWLFPWTALTSWTLERKRNVFPVRYEFNFYILFITNSFFKKLIRLSNLEFFQSMSYSQYQAWEEFCHSCSYIFIYFDISRINSYLSCKSNENKCSSKL